MIPSASNEMEKALSTLPQGLDGTYQRIIQSIPEVNRRKAITILQLLAFSDRPLTIDELVDAVAVDLSETPKFEPALRVTDLSEVTRYCLGLVAPIYEQEGKESANTKSREVRLAHFSVKEYLISSQFELGLWQDMGMLTSRTSLATICIAYLAAINTDMSESEIKETFPFAKYSAESWLGHASSRSTGAKLLSDLILNFLLHNEVSYRNWFRLYDPDIYFRFSLGGARENPAPGLYYACLHGFVLDVEALISHSVDVNQKGGQCFYALIAAAHRGHAKIVQLLLANGANVDVRGPYDRTALSFALTAGHEEIARLLLSAGADVNASDVWHRSILDSACRAGDLNNVKLLVEQGAMIVPPDGTSGSALEAACSEGHEEIVDFILSQKVDMSALGSDSRSPLTSAASAGHTQIVSKLLQQGASLRQKPNEARSPLCSASANGHEDIVRILLRAGAHPNDRATDDSGHPLHAALENGHTSVAWLLIQEGADVNVKNRSGSTVLQVACKKRLENMLPLLLDHKADINDAGNWSDGSALEIVVSAGLENLAPTLLDKGAEVNCNRSQHVGSGALYAACERGNHRLVKTLLERGADINSTGYAGTVLQTAISKGHTDIVRMLLNYGADVERVPEGSGSHRASRVSHSPLLRAYERRDWTMMRMLLEHGVDLHRLAGNYWENDSVLEIACLQNNVTAIKMLLQWSKDASLGLPAACFKGHLSLAKLLLDSGVDVHTTNAKYGDTLGAAAFQGHVKVVQLLLERGAAVNASSSAHGSALIAASVNGHKAVVEALLSVGANPNATAESDPHPMEAKNHHVHDRRGHRSSIQYGNAIQAASYNGDEDTVRSLIAVGADCNLIGGEYGSALGAASFKGHESVVQLLLENGAHVNAPGGRYANAIALACVLGHEGIAKILITNGADPNATSKNSESALLTAIHRGYTRIVRIMLDGIVASIPLHPDTLTAAIKRGDDDLVSILLDRVQDQTGRDGIDALHAAAAAGKKDLVQELLHRGANLHASGSSFRNAIIAASTSDNVELVQLLLDKGADPNEQFDTVAGNSDIPNKGNVEYSYINALHAASQKGQIETVRLLLQRGAISTATGGEHNDLLEATFSSYTETFRDWRVHDAFARKHGRFPNEPKPTARFETILRLLLDAGADAHWEKEKYNALLLQSSSAGMESIVSILLNKDADIDTFDEALVAALNGEHSNVVWILLEHGAKLTDWGSHYGDWKKMLLHFAAEAGREDVVRRCIGAQVNVNEPDRHDRTPLHYATISGHHEIIGMLLDGGAEPSTHVRDRSYNTPLSYARGVEDRSTETKIGPHPLCVRALTQWQGDGS